MIIVVDRDNPKYKSIDGVLFEDYLYGDNERYFAMICYPGAKKNTEFEIPSGVSYAVSFSCNPNLKKLVIPGSLTHWHYNPLSHIDEISIYFDFDDFLYDREDGLGWRVVRDLIEDCRGINGTIYIRNSTMRDNIIELLKEEYDAEYYDYDNGYSDCWTVSDDFEW